MRKPVLVALLAAALAGTAWAERDNPNPLDSGSPIGTGWSDTGQFSALKAVGPEDVRFSTGSRWQLRAEGDPQTISRLRFIVEDNQLIIGRRSGETGKLRPATVYVVAPALRRATIGGSGTLEIDRLSGKKVSAAVAGSGDLSIGNIDADALDAKLAGSGAMRLKGRTGAASLAIAGSGDLNGPDLLVDTADTRIAGSGSMAFRSNGRVSANIVGSGTVSVRGTADCSRLTRVGSGTLRCGA